MEEIYYNNTTAIVDPSVFENKPIKVPGWPERVNDTSVLHEYAHTNFTSTQIDIDSVAYQLSNDIQHPKTKAVTVNQLLTGEPYHLYELHDKRDNTSSSDKSGSNTGDSTSTDTSTSVDTSAGKIYYSNGKYYNLITGTSNDPNSFAYDGNGNSIPDSIEWKTV